MPQRFPAYPFPRKKTILPRSVCLDTAPNSAKHLCQIFNALFQQNPNAHVSALLNKEGFRHMLKYFTELGPCYYLQKAFCFGFIVQHLQSSYGFSFCIPSPHTAKLLGLQFSSRSHRFKIRIDIISSCNFTFLAPYLHRNMKKKKGLKAEVIYNNRLKKPPPRHCRKHSHRK